MDMSAFHADAAVRSVALARLNTCFSTNGLKPGPLAWNGQAGSVVGCLIASDDVTMWPQQLGLPLWLAYALDAITTWMPAAQALEASQRVLNAIPLGADVRHQASGFICRLLDQSCSPVPVVPSAVLESLQQVLELHHSLYACAEVAPERWKLTRRMAVLATDRVDRQQSPRDHAFAMLLEAATWDPVSSPVNPAEVLRQWHSLESSAAAQQFGWEPADDALARELLERMHREFVLTNQHQGRDVFQLLEEHHPASAERLQAWVRFTREYSVSCAQRATQMLVELFEPGRSQ